MKVLHTDKKLQERCALMKDKSAFLTSNVRASTAFLRDCADRPDPIVSVTAFRADSVNNKLVIGEMLVDRVHGLTSMEVDI